MARTDDGGRTDDHPMVREQVDRLSWLTQLLDHVPDAVVARRADGTLLAVNRGAEQMWGWAADELIGRNFADLLLPPGHPGFTEEGGVVAPAVALAALGATGEWRGRVLSMRRDGTVFPATVRLKLVRPDGADPYVLAVVTDITDVVRAELELAQHQRLDAMGQLTGGVAHDFNNLLTVITGAASVLGELVAEPRAVALVRSIEHAAERGAELTGRLLAFARRQELRPDDVDVGQVVDQVAEMLRRTIDPRIALVIDPPASPAAVHVDRGQLEVALLNLCLNARDAMPDGGTLAVRWGAADGRTCIAVADDGEGMEPEVARRAFEPFFTTKQAGKGTGLGLAMVHGFVLQSGGSIRIDSHLGAGTEVVVELPAA